MARHCFFFHSQRQTWNLRLDTETVSEENPFNKPAFFGGSMFFCSGCVSIFCCIFGRSDFGSRLTSGRCAWVFQDGLFFVRRQGDLWCTDGYPSPTSLPWSKTKAAASLCSAAVAEVMVFCLESASSANALATHLAARCVAAGGPVGTLETCLKV